MNPVVAIVGRPNVGKSTLMNRIVGRREAIVEERPGVTRDRKEVEASWLDREFTLVDTGGWMAGGDDLDDKVSRQSEKAIKDADVILFVVDSTVGITDDDAKVAALLRQRTEQVILVANKVDDRNHESAVWELMSLGLGEPASISALHGRGTGDMLDRLIALLPEPQPEPEVDEEEDRIISVSLVGRPNVGKSTLFNRLIGEDRAVVHDRPGTTRDAIDTVVESEYGPVRFIDTAGMRRKARIDEDTEYYSLVRALKAADAADVALLVIDSTVGVTHQDQRLAERVDAAGCPVVVLLNKWDLCDAETRADVSDQVGMKLHFVGAAPVIKISALTGKNVTRLWPALADTIESYRTRIPTRRVNDVIREAQQAQPAPGGARVLYATQGATDPPTFTLFANYELPRTWLRYLERRLREDLELGATPIKVRVRKRSE
ncbi:MAG: ribosome biogenesis GTPase Der [Actinobacteria bacterium]|jgi:GTP-binding protein|nr:ribosome biogenesis GTPase Der [Actinomycetota bacterium]MBT3746760.1 ribosome biogenesis GTPase Der [Actinomycetota bacterium]MBT3969453.1 ribosome biogenesis GTPase Der [Actinomycetota bacterium]MBT4010181.1 ribosome biogenesis GTPase Der [Actinomycetota bacterium]MBT4302127.1 ribosome biogenesis GTPase Der [Actinomycetota bacterium]